MRTRLAHTQGLFAAAPSSKILEIKSGQRSRSSLRRRKSTQRPQAMIRLAPAGSGTGCAFRLRLLTVAKFEPMPKADVPPVTSADKLDAYRAGGRHTSRIQADRHIPGRDTSAQQAGNVDQGATAIHGQRIATGIDKFDVKGGVTPATVLEQATVAVDTESSSYTGSWLGS